MKHNLDSGNILVYEHPQLSNYLQLVESVLAFPAQTLDMTERMMDVLPSSGSNVVCQLCKFYIHDPPHHTWHRWPCCGKCSDHVHNVDIFYRALGLGCRRLLSLRGDQKHPLRAGCAIESEHILVERRLPAFLQFSVAVNINDFVVCHLRENLSIMSIAQVMI